MFVFALLSPVPTRASAEVTWPLRQGLHEFSALDGQLKIVVGTYQDTTTFRRSYHIYFVRNGHSEWNQIPIVSKAGAMDFFPTSTSHGDVTVEDWVPVRKGKEFYFVRVSKKTEHGGVASAPITATWFQFLETSDDQPQEPAYALRPIFMRKHVRAQLNVEAVLRKESTLQPSN